jgi:hypothetical protein
MILLPSACRLPHFSLAPDLKNRAAYITPNLKGSLYPDKPLPARSVASIAVKIFLTYGMVKSHAF